MIPAVAQTLAEILAGGTSLINTEQIDFSHPSMRQDVKPSLNLYCYSIQTHYEQQGQEGAFAVCPDSADAIATLNPLPLWVDVSFLISAWDHTALGEQRLLSEVLSLLSSHRFLPKKSLVPSLQGHRLLPMRVSAEGLTDSVALWIALGVPLRPAIHITVTVPVDSTQTYLQSLEVV